MFQSTTYLDRVDPHLDTAGRVLTFVREHYRATQQPVSIVQIMRACHVSPQVAATQLATLQRLGFIKRQRFVARSIRPTLPM